MKDNPFKRAFTSFKTGKAQLLDKLRKRWDRLSFRQQKVIILWLLGLFAAIDLAYIAGGFCGTNQYPIEVRHIQRIMLPDTDSIQSLNSLCHDTIQ